MVLFVNGDSDEVKISKAVFAKIEEEFRREFVFVINEPKEDRDRHIFEGLQVKYNQSPAARVRRGNFVMEDYIWRVEGAVMKNL